MEPNAFCWCPICEMVFESRSDTERWITERRLFIPPKQGQWLNLAAHLAFNDPSKMYFEDAPAHPDHRGDPVENYPEYFLGPYRDTPQCPVRGHLWKNALFYGGKITCWCGEWFGGTNNVENFAQHLWVTNDQEEGGLDQHYRQSVATRILGEM